MQHSDGLWRFGPEAQYRREVNDLNVRLDLICMLLSQLVAAASGRSADDVLQSNLNQIEANLRAEKANHA
jgi:hypothetical protein